MKIAVVGAGASGSYLAIRIKELNLSFSVSLFERNDKLMKKINVTGNGRCNYANLGATLGKYHNDAFANKILNNLKAKEIVSNFERYGIHPTCIDNLVYPVSLSAQTVVLMLEKRLKELDVDIHLTVLTFLSCNDDHTISGTATIDRSRGCIFQHLDRLDIG